MESNLKLAYTYVKCWMRWLEEVADGICVRDGVWRGVQSAGSDDDQVGNNVVVLRATGQSS